MYVVRAPRLRGSHDLGGPPISIGLPERHAVKGLQLWEITAMLSAMTHWL